MKRVLAALLFLLAGSVLDAGQAPQAPPADRQTPTFQSNVEYVEVDVLVTDQQGNFVANLTKEDFEVREDGKPQNVAAFSLVNIPVEQPVRPLFANRVIEPDIQSNERPFNGRTYVMLLDDLHTDVLRTQRVKIAAREFIEKKLGANDLMAVVTIGGPSRTSQEFTSNKRLLLAAVDAFVGQKLQSSTLARNAQYFRQSVAGDSSPIDDPEEFQRQQFAQRTLRSVRDISEWFGGVRGRRKTILLLSEGIDYDITDLVPQAGSSHNGAAGIMDDMNEAIGAAQRANVSIYSIDPRGLTLAGDDDITVGSFADQGAQASTTGDDGSSQATGPPNNIGMRNLMSEVRLSQDTLRRISDDTGGIASVNRNDFGAVFNRIVADNSSYYLLAYYPPSDKRDGKFHKIQVRVKGREGLTVRSRSGYTSPRGKAPAPPAANNTSSVAVREALGSPLPVSGLGMNVFAAPFKGISPNASVLFGVEMRGTDLSLNQGDIVEISYMAVDAQGKVRGPIVSKVTMRLRPETKAAVEQNGFRVLNRLDLPPGRYQLRLATHDNTGGAVGSVVYDLDIPDFYKQPFSMSGIVLTSLAGAAMTTARPDDQLKAVLPAPPIAMRTFPQNDELALFTEVYDNSGNSPHKVDIVATVTSDTGTVVFKNEEARDSSELQGKSGGYGYAARVPLSDIPPGLYVLKVEATSRLGDGRTAGREILFNITPRTQ